MKSSPRYLPLGGSRRAYYDTVHRQVISRRQYLKRHGVFPRGGKHRSLRKAAPLSVPFISQPPQPFVKMVRLSRDVVAEVHPRTATTYILMIRHVSVAPLNLEQRGKRRRWHCGIGGCPNVYDDTYRMARHCYEAHYLDACSLAGVVAPTILPVHEIHTSERKSRMPWRVISPEHENLLVTHSPGSVSQ